LIKNIFSRNTTKQKAFSIVLLLFVLGIFIRLPNLNRPVSKHYEFNSAVILINIISWRQAGGGDRFHFTPVMNFQHSGDKQRPNNLYVDSHGNSVYLSFGPGWYIIPYFFYQLFQLPAEPVYLEILNLIFHLATILVFFYFLEQIIPAGQQRKYFIISVACCFMIFSPGPLWFMGNGYINTGIMLPFVLGAFMLLLPMLQEPGKISAGRLSALGLLIIVLIYIDWYILFACFLSGILALVKYRQSKKYGLLMLVLLISTISGTALLFFQFSAHMGPEAVIHYWLSRSSERSLNLAGSSILTRLGYLFIYFLTSYLPLLILLLAGYLRCRRSGIIPNWSEKEILFLKLFGSSLLFYNFFLFNWSSDHEFSILPWSIFLSLPAARVLGSLKNRRLIRGLLAFFLLSAVMQYYWINRPGTVSRDGLPYSSFKTLGESLKNIPADYSIFISLEQNPMVEYYAGRNLFHSPDSLTAEKEMKELGIIKAVWVDHKGYQVEHIHVIRKAD